MRIFPKHDVECTPVTRALPVGADLHVDVAVSVHAEGTDDVELWIPPA